MMADIHDELLDHVAKALAAGEITADTTMLAALVMAHIDAAECNAAANERAADALAALALAVLYDSGAGHDDAVAEACRLAERAARREAGK